MSQPVIDISSDYGLDISSRFQAVALRRRILQESSQEISLDFESVRTLSDSFADELFGVLVEDLGVDWIRNHLRIVNLSEEVRNTILQAVQHRLDSQLAG